LLGSNGIWVEESAVTSAIALRGSWDIALHARIENSSVRILVWTNELVSIEVVALRSPIANDMLRNAIVLAALKHDGQDRNKAENEPSSILYMVAAF